MKILFILSNANCRGGTEILAYNLLHQLNEAGIECWLLSSYKYNGEDPRVLSLSDADFNQWQKLRDNPLNKILGSALSDVLFGKLVAKIAHTYHVDWIINHTYDLIGAMPTDTTFNTAQIFNWSIIGYEANLKIGIRNKPFMQKWMSRFSLAITKQRWHRSIPRFTKLVVLTKAAYEEMKEISYSITEAQLCIIPNPLMKSKESPCISTQDNNNIVFVGRLSHEKGVMRLLRIWELASKQLPNHTLRIYGEGHLRKEMDEYVNRHKIERIAFMGFCNSLETIYTHADLCCVTSDTEGFGMVLIEAMYYGVPCISFDCPVSPKEIISNAGIIIPCFDEEAYAQQIVELLKNKPFMKQLQRMALLRAKDYYIDGILQKWRVMLQNK